MSSVRASMQDTPPKHRVLAAIAALIACGVLVPMGAQSDHLSRHRVPADFMSFRGAEWLERGDRVREEQPERVLDAMGVGSGDVVADIGCGSGYYARRIARRVQPLGRVICEDIQPEMLDIMRSRADEEGVARIEAVLGTPTDPRLPAAEVDWVILADVYHEMSEPEAMLAAIRRALSPRGRVALLEYRVEDGSGDAIKADHRMSVRQVLQEWGAAGFELEALHEFLPSQHLFFFRSTGARDSASPLPDYDLFEAVEAGIVEAEAFGRSDRSVTIRVRRTGSRPVLLTSAVGTVFHGDGLAQDMVARRDGWLVVDEEGWQEWSVRALGRQPDRDPPRDGQPLEIVPPSVAPTASEVVYQAQVGTYTVADSPTLYIPTTHAVEQAALWIADADLGFEDLRDRVEDERIPDRYVLAFALVLLDQASIDVATRRVWADRVELFDGLRDQGLSIWYRLRETRP